jgi:hypothetical protein
VIIEVRRNGRWEWLSRSWLRRGGRFYVAVSVDVGASRKVMLRARVVGVGRSKPLAARL